jgi:hypothetical protein
MIEANRVWVDNSYKCSISVGGELLVGAVKKVYAEFRDPDTGALTDPSTVKISVEILNATVTDVLSAASMTKESTGLYYYNLSLATAGPYVVMIVASDGTIKEASRLYFTVTTPDQTIS